MLNSDVRINPSTFRREGFKKHLEPTMGRRSIKNLLIFLVIGSLALTTYLLLGARRSGPVKASWKGAVQNMMIAENLKNDQDNGEDEYNDPGLGNQLDAVYGRRKENANVLQDFVDKAKALLRGDNDYPSDYPAEYPEDTITEEEEKEEEEYFKRYHDNYVKQDGGDDYGADNQEEDDDYVPNDRENGDENDNDDYPQEGEEADKEHGQDDNGRYDNRKDSKADVPPEYLMRNRFGQVIGEKLFDGGINPNAVKKDDNDVQDDSQNNGQEVGDLLDDREDEGDNGGDFDMRPVSFPKENPRDDDDAVIDDFHLHQGGQPHDEDLLGNNQNGQIHPFQGQDSRNELPPNHGNEHLIDPLNPNARILHNPFDDNDNNARHENWKDQTKYTGQKLGVILRPFGAHGVNPMFDQRHHRGHEGDDPAAGHRPGENLHNGLEAFGLQDINPGVNNNAQPYNPNVINNFRGAGAGNPYMDRNSRLGGGDTQGGAAHRLDNQQDPFASMRLHKPGLADQSLLQKQDLLQQQQPLQQQQQQQQQLQADQAEADQDELRRQFQLKKFLEEQEALKQQFLLQKQEQLQQQNPAGQQQQQQEEPSQEELRQQFQLQRQQEMQQQQQQQQQQQEEPNQEELRQQFQLQRQQEMQQQQQQEQQPEPLQQPQQQQEIQEPNLSEDAPKSNKIYIEDLSLPLPIEANCIEYLFSTGEGTLCLHSGDKDAGVSAKIEKDGTYEEDILQQVVEILEDDETLGLVDIGAGLGIYTLDAALMGRQVLAVEPLFRNYRLLHKSALENEVTNLIVLVTQALDNDTYVGQMTYSSLQGYSQVNISRIAPGMEVDRANIVRVTTLNALAEVAPFTSALMKLDVNEGLEMNILRASQDFLNKVRVPFIITHWSQSTDRNKHALIFAQLAALGYHPKLAWNGADVNVDELQNDLTFLVWKKDGVSEEQ